MPKPVTTGMSATCSSIVNNKVFLTQLQKSFAFYRESNSNDIIEGSGLLVECILVRFFGSLDPSKREFV